ncbi:hypothetical protein [Polaribacter sp. SA4-12]|uniref:hypothetical protein n=1 Tax=Polaribacter sp. SA4-12 TaxID=1312072 RepID=UPI0012FCDEE8|nr:hypothetical protein [Polaribacter sp. SA4-12]
MKFKIVLFFAFLMSSIPFFGQIKISDEAYTVYQKIPQEKIYVHYNSNFLLTGESLIYKIYCLNTSTYLFSDFSQIAYIELINANKERVLKQKIRLKKGIGQGDFFIATDLPSGNYKLIAYTEWMKNKNSFYEESINIINPFTQKIATDTINSKNSSILKKDILPLTTKNGFLETNKIHFSKREQVTLNFNENLINRTSGNFSISVRKTMPNVSSEKTTPLEFTQSENHNKLENHNSENKIFLPELRGELIQGKIVALDDEQSIENKAIGLSIIEKNGIYKIVNTKKDGTFYFNLPEEYASEKAIVQILESNKNDYKLIISESKSLDLSSLKFSAIKTNSQINKSIRERAIYLQVENAYNELHQDSILPPKQVESLFKNALINYKLDDYTRFNTIKETTVEVIKNTWLTKEGDNYTFHVRDNNLHTNYQTKPLVLIDGYIINNHNELVDFNPKLIKQIAIIRNKYKFNANIYQGVISVKTFKGDYTPSSNEKSLSITLFKPLPIKKYYSKNYTNTDLKRVPDYRTQLFWNPNINLTEKNITFFTSDVTGHFETILEGFTNDGKPIYEKIIFTVK